MRIGLSSIVGDGFGFGSFVFGEVPSGGGGSGYAYTAYGVTYPIEEGGASVQVLEIEVAPIASQICDVDYYYEGGGGEPVPNWSTATNVQYRPNGYRFTGNETPSSQTPVEVPFESGNFYDSEYVAEYAALSDGAGSYTWQPVGVEYWAEDTPIYDNGTDVFLWDGSGGYKTIPL